MDKREETRAAIVAAWREDAFDPCDERPLECLSDVRHHGVGQSVTSGPWEGWIPSQLVVDALLGERVQGRTSEWYPNGNHGEIIAVETTPFPRAAWVKWDGGSVEKWALCGLILD